MQTYAMPTAFDVGGFKDYTLPQEHDLALGPKGQSSVKSVSYRTYRASNSMPIATSVPTPTIAAVPTPTQTSTPIVAAHSQPNSHCAMPTTIYNPNKYNASLYAPSNSTVYPTASEAGYKAPVSTGPLLTQNATATYPSTYAGTTPAYNNQYSANPYTAQYGNVYNQNAVQYNNMPTNVYAPTAANSYGAANTYTNVPNGYNQNGYNQAAYSYPQNINNTFPAQVNQSYPPAYPANAASFQPYGAPMGPPQPMGPQPPSLNPYSQMDSNSQLTSPYSAPLSTRALYGPSQVPPTAPCVVPAANEQLSHEERVAQMRAVQQAEREAEQEYEESNYSSPKPFCYCASDAVKSAQTVGSQVVEGTGKGVSAVKQFGEATVVKAREIDEQYKVQDKVKQGFQTSSDTIVKGFQWTAQTIKETDEKYQISTKVSTTAQSVGKTVYEQGQKGWQAATKSRQPAPQI
eukprot:Platyproteum_vivax@DN4210_c0_g1_i1.p1